MLSLVVTKISCELFCETICGGELPKYVTATHEEAKKKREMRGTIATRADEFLVELSHQWIQIATLHDHQFNLKDERQAP